MKSTSNNTSYHATDQYLTVLFALLTAICCQAFAEPIDFVDPKLSACVTITITKEKLSSAENLTSLTCNAQGIRDAKGLERLTKLEKLSLFGNQLTSIDLQNLTALTELNLANNRLKRIDLSNNSELQILYLFGNGLETLNLEATPQPEKIQAEKNRLLSVKFGELSALKKVYLFDNEMKDIEIDTLPALRFLDVRSNPMPDEVYDYLDEFSGVKASHDGNTEDWK